VTNGQLPKLVTVRDILRVTHPERSSVSKIAFRPAIISLDTPIYDAAMKLVHNRVRILPVIENESGVGVVLQTKILDKMADREELKDFLSEDSMVKNPITVDRDFSVRVIRSIMLRRGISHTPIVDQNGRLKGMITAKDLVWHFIKPRDIVTALGERKGEKLRIFEMSIRGLVDTHPLHVTPRTSIIDVVSEMVALKKSYCLVVEERRPVGIITPRDVIKLLTKFRPKAQIPLCIFGFKDDIKICGVLAVLGMISELFALFFMFAPIILVAIYLTVCSYFEYRRYIR